MLRKTIAVFVIFFRIFSLLACDGKSPVTTSLTTITTSTTISSTSTTAVNNTVLIPDKNLEKAIREALGKPEGTIAKADMATIVNIVAKRQEIENLGGLEYCVNMESLAVPFNNISDISPLSSLTNLKELDLTSNKVNDLTVLSGGKFSYIALDL